MQPMGFQQIAAATLANSTGLTIPVDAAGLKPDFCIIHPDTQNVRWRDDGVAPTAAIGMRLLVGAERRIDGLGAMVAVRFIVETAGANLNISYYRYTTDYLKN